MSDDRNDSAHLIGEPELNLTAPLFDERATANAQPVQPIPTSRGSGFNNRAAALRRALTSSSRALALVVIAGLATGTLVGMAWVKEPQVTAVSPSASESASESAPTDLLNGSPNSEPRAETVGGTGLQSASPATGIRGGRSRLRSTRATRAYRVAVLR